MEKIVILLSVVALALGQTTPRPSQCGHTPIQPNVSRIVGGHVATPGSWPWQAEMCMGSSFGGSCPLRCGGAIIDKNWIMSAAHCVVGYTNTPQNFHMKVGVQKYSDNNETGEVVTNITKIVVHPKYGSPLENSYDISLLKLSQPLQWTDHIQPVCIPKNVDDLLVDNTTMWVTGWGATSEGGPVSKQLRQVSVPSLSMAHCQQEYPNQVDDTMICAGRKGVDSCQGDSGGPLVTKHTDGRWFQAGIVSWGYGCAEKNHAGVYGRTSAMCDFIKSQVGYDVCQ